MKALPFVVAIAVVLGGVAVFHTRSNVQALAEYSRYQDLRIYELELRVAILEVAAEQPESPDIDRSPVIGRLAETVVLMTPEQKSAYARVRRLCGEPNPKETRK